MCIPTYDAVYFTVCDFVAPYLLHENTQASIYEHRNVDT